MQKYEKRVTSPKRLSRALSVLGLVLILTSCTGDNMTTPALEIKTTTQPLGRFIIDLPETAEKGGYKWNFGHVSIVERPWPEDLGREAGRGLLWEQHIKELENIPIRGVNKEQPKPTIEVIEPNEEGLWYKQSLYYDHDEFVSRLKWDILADMGSHPVWFSIKKREQIKDILGRVLLETLENYKPYVSGQDIDYKLHNFYMERGAINLPFDSIESVWAGFVDKSHAFELDITVRTNKADGDLTLISHTKWAASELPKAYGKAKILRSGPRTIEGLAGEEVIVEVKERYEGQMNHYVQFKWHYNGDFETADKPDIRIELEGSVDNIKEKTALWDSILNSMRYVGE